MATKKIERLTKKDKFETLASFFKENPASFIVEKNGTELDFTDVVEFLENEIELLVKKNSAERKPDVKKMAVDNALKAEIMAVLDDGVRRTIGEIQKESAELAELSNQKMSFLLSELEKSGRVVKTIEKRKGYYSAV